MHWFYLILAITAEVFATSMLKLTEGMTKPLPILGVILGYGTAFFLLSLTLKVLPVGVAYAIWSGVGIVLISLVGWIWFKQVLDLPALIGIGLIAAGILVLQVFSKVGHA
jgi:small multidrug resistance pump